jgi:hypothetical protein
MIKYETRAGIALCSETLGTRLSSIVSKLFVLSLGGPVLLPEET